MLNRMEFPVHLFDRIQQMLEHVSQRELQSIWSSMSQGYRSGRPITLDHRSVLAYLVGRCPGTYAAMYRVLQESGPIPSTWQLHLDVGAGPGTACWAVQELAPHLRQIAVERSAAWSAAATALSPAIAWQREDLTHLESFTEADLITAGYSLSELADDRRSAVVDRLWQACRGRLIIVEPGTQVGYRACLAIRDQLVRQGAHVIAPCPGMVPCPLIDSEEWCHFGVRVSRSRAMMTMKAVDQGWEEEVYSYIVLSREPQPIASRVLHTPQKRSRHINLDLCSSNGRESVTLTKRDGALYSKARRLAWGNSIMLTVE